jgi:hypothetical protein
MIVRTLLYGMNDNEKFNALMREELPVVVFILTQCFLFIFRVRFYIYSLFFLHYYRLSTR